MSRKLMLGALVGTLLIGPLSAAAGEPEARLSLGVMEFSSKGGLDTERMEALSDMLQNAIRESGSFRVLGKSDVGAVLSLEEHKRLVGCDDESCMAEIGGALGVQFLVSGNLSLFGQTYLLNLKLLDVRRVEVVRGISRSITGAEDQLVAALPLAVRDLIQGLKPGEVGGGLVDVQAAEPEGFFVPPGRRKGRISLQLDLGLSLLTPNYVRGEIVSPYEQATKSAIDDVGLAWRARLALGYNFLDWLSLRAAVGLDLGAHVESNTDRKLAGLDLGLQLVGAFNQDSWVQPLAYLGLGLALLWDRNGSLLHPDDGVEGKGVMVELGLGVNMYVLPRLYLGLRAGGRVNAFFNLGYDPDGEDVAYNRLPGLWAWGIAVEAAGMVGYEF
jgi:hypothetical protein